MPVTLKPDRALDGVINLSQAVVKTLAANVALCDNLEV